MFVEHVYLPHSSNKDVISYVRRLDAVSLFLITVLCIVNAY